MPANSQPRTYAMPERSDRLDFYIRDQTTRQPITEPHRHAYFQIQFNLGGDTQQRIGGVTRPFPRGALAFILPFREHLIPHPPGAHFIVINFSQQFLRSDLDVDPLDLDDVPVQRVPELAPFRFQERLDYILTGDAFEDARRLAQRMLDVNRERSFGSVTLLRGYLLQLIGLVSTQYAGALGKLAQSHGAQKAGRRDALARVMRHIRANLTSGELTLTGTAEAAFLSPNYLAHLIRKETGSTFTELVTERRIALAQSLLAHTTRRIADIAHDVGFRDEGYFSRRFRACVGMSPKDYREANGEDAEARAAGLAAAEAGAGAEADSERETEVDADAETGAAAAGIDDNAPAGDSRTAGAETKAENTSDDPGGA
ncbi:helix-turn-helix transcriptional regulator [Burkholderia sp. Cy-647]|nr:helix-turn-helix transcriptional regulator [Burkholderia sp. Tr-860]NIF67254.1 helix-turn-helix transcriptional regulator [Burkholderia sp. Cy-647]NIG00389.1 helix-turn-helix transcriptional regulator [Burkholderia sp. Ax-1720]